MSEKAMVDHDFALHLYNMCSKWLDRTENHDHNNLPENFPIRVRSLKYLKAGSLQLSWTKIKELCNYLGEPTPKFIF